MFQVGKVFILNKSFTNSVTIMDQDKLMLYKVKLDVEELFMVKKSLNFTENIRIHNSVNKFKSFCPWSLKV